MHRAPSRLPLVAALACAAALAGCGRKGALEPPPGLPQARLPAPTEAQARGPLSDMDTPGLIQSPNIVYEESAIAKLNSAVKNPARPINAPPEPARGGFLLDPLVR